MHKTMREQFYEQKKEQDTRDRSYVTTETFTEFREKAEANIEELREKLA